MDEALSITKPELSHFKPIQEQIENGDGEVPARYIWSEENSAENIEIPVIDLSKLISPCGKEAMDAELEKLRLALSSWGCFQVINHGMESSFLDEVRQVSRQFFHMPVKDKQKYAGRGDDIEGYGNDMVMSEDTPLDWSDRLQILVSPWDKQNLKYWPQNPQSFRNMLQEYTAKIIHIKEQLLKSIAKSISLPEDSFLNQFGERPIIYARFNNYPPCSRPDKVIGLKPHADAGVITLLLQDEEIEGLQLQKGDNHWLQVPVIPQALVVNVADQLQIMSNGIFKSPIHRVVIHSKRERNSLAMFCAPEPEKEIGPVEELVDEKSPRLYKQVRNYAQVYFQHLQSEKRAIDAFKV